jgi:hypothetical protein
MAVEAVNLVVVECCHLCDVELTNDARVIVVAFETPLAPRVLAHAHCAARVAAKIRANE